MKSILKTSLYILVAVLVGVSAVYATSKLTPPGSVANTMYSLEDIYNLASGATTTEGTGAIETTPGTIVETGKTLTEVYTAISTEIAKLSSGVIASGTSAFGIIGNTNVVNTSSGDAAVTDILTGKKAWVDGVEVTGTAVAGTPAPIFATTNQTTYTCESLTVDPTQPALTLQTICGYHSGDGCSWSGSACVGGTKTPSNGNMTWYAGTASCANSTAEGQTSGTWRLPTSVELHKNYIDNNIGGNPPPGFVLGQFWSSSVSPSGGLNTNAYPLSTQTGTIASFDKNTLGPGVKAHCAR